jgi:hypothetical protein
MAKPFIVQTAPEVVALIDGRPMLPPPRLRRTWVNSRLVGQDDGSTIPLVILIAEKKFGPWDPKAFYAVWKDKDWCNESMDNVILVAKSISHEPRRNPYGVPAGSPEYYKLYRRDHPEKVKEWQKKAYTKRRNVLKENEELREKNAALSAQLLGTLPPSKEADLANRLDNILGEGLDTPTITSPVEKQPYE